MNSFLDLLKTKIVSKLSDHHKFNSYLNCDSFVLQLYHKIGVVIFFLLYTGITLNQFIETPIVCNPGFNTEKKVEFHYVNYCLSYPKIKDNKYALFYKWVSWIMFILCILFYSPKVFVNHLSCKYTSTHLLQASKLNNNFKHNNTNKKKDAEENNEKSCHYKKRDFDDFISIKWNKCKEMYFRCLFCHLYSLILNVATFCLLDFFLQQRFLLYVPKIWPMTRDAENFSDAMSVTFYPFSKCVVPMDRLVHSREEVLYCHLTLMEYYEKIFVFIWFYLVLLFIVNLIYVIFLGFLCRNNYNAFFIHLIKKSVDYNLYVEVKQQRRSDNAKSGNLVV